MINSLAFCAQAVLTEAQIMAGAGQAAPRAAASAPFAADDLKKYLDENAAAVGAAGFPELAATLGKLAGEAEQYLGDLEQLEQRLTALEEKLVATLRSRQTDEELFNARRDLDAQLRPYRGKMSAEQLAMLGKQYLERQLLERSNLPRLSLFYMR